MNVLILTDLSEVAKNATLYAVNLLQKIPVNFYILHIGIFNENLKTKNIQEREQIVLDKINQDIKKLRDRLQNKEHSFSAVYSEDNPVNAIRKFKVEKEIDLIITGASSKGSSPKTIIGNFTFEIILKVKCNLLAIPEKPKGYEPKRIVAPVDFSTGLDEKSFYFLNTPGIIDKAEVTVLSILEDEPEDHHRQRQNPVLKVENKTFNYIEAQRKEISNETLLSRVQEEFDLIVMLAKNLRVCDKFLHNRYGIYTSVRNHLPILVLH